MRFCWQRNRSMDKFVFSGESIAPQLTDAISAGGRIWLVVTGSSMKPFLKHGRDMVCLRAWNEEDVKIGQILLFQRPNRSLVLHRIRKRLPDGTLLMNGDAQAWSEPISTKQILAVVSSVQQNGRYMDCNSFLLWLWNWLWYPTRPVRPILFKVWRILFRRKGGV